MEAVLRTAGCSRLDSLGAPSSKKTKKTATTNANYTTITNETDTETESETKRKTGSEMNL